jgi:hypothetical protein
LEAIELAHETAQLSLSFVSVTLDPRASAAAYVLMHGFPLVARRPDPLRRDARA